MGKDELTQVCGYPPTLRCTWEGGAPPIPRPRPPIGPARVIDGDTVEIGQTHIRLDAIDAPEKDQSCLDRDVKTYCCGVTARDRLAKHIGNREVSCIEKGHDRYGRTLAECFIVDEDLNAWMVRQRLALAFVRYSTKYRPQQDEAREQLEGMWSGAFIAPWDWRHRNRQTEILGATSVPIDAQDKLLPPISKRAPSAEGACGKRQNSAHLDAPIR